MKQLEFRACPYKAVDASGKRNVIYRVYDGNVCIAARHEDTEKGYIGAVVRQYTIGNHTSYSMDTFRTEPSIIPDGVYGIARVTPTPGQIVSGTDAKYTDGTKVKVSQETGIIEF